MYDHFFQFYQHVQCLKNHTCTSNKGKKNHARIFDFDHEKMKRKELREKKKEEDDFDFFFFLFRYKERIGNKEKSECTTNKIFPIHLWREN